MRDERGVSTQPAHKKTELIVAALENKPFRLFDIFYFKQEPSEDLLQIIRESGNISGQTIAFDLSGTFDFENIVSAIENGQNQLLLVKYPHFEIGEDTLSTAGDMDQILNVYFYLQTRYFHTKKSSDNLVVQMYDESLLKALSVAKMGDTIAKMPLTPHIELT